MQIALKKHLTIKVYFALKVHFVLKAYLTLNVDLALCTIIALNNKSAVWSISIFSQISIIMKRLQSFPEVPDSSRYVKIGEDLSI